MHLGINEVEVEIETDSVSIYELILKVEKQIGKEFHAQLIDADMLILKLADFSLFKVYIGK